jgi:hypothetical protein
MAPLCGGVELVGLAKRPELYQLLGDITSYDEGTKRYHISIRGCPSDHRLSSGVMVKKEEESSLVA